MQMAVLCALFANANRRQGAAPFHASDFLPYKEQVREQSEEEMRLICELMAGGAEVPYDDIEP